MKGTYLLLLILTACECVYSGKSYLEERTNTFLTALKLTEVKDKDSIRIIQSIKDYFSEEVETLAQWKENVKNMKIKLSHKPESVAERNIFLHVVNYVAYINGHDTQQKQEYHKKSKQVIHHFGSIIKYKDSKDLDIHQLNSFISVHNLLALHGLCYDCDFHSYFNELFEKTLSKFLEAVVSSYNYLEDAPSEFDANLRKSFGAAFLESSTRSYVYTNEGDLLPKAQKFYGCVSDSFNAQEKKELYKIKKCLEENQNLRLPKAISTFLNLDFNPELVTDDVKFGMFQLLMDGFVKSIEGSSVAFIPYAEGKELLHQLLFRRMIAQSLDTESFKIVLVKLVMLNINDFNKLNGKILNIGLFKNIEFAIEKPYSFTDVVSQDSGLENMENMGCFGTLIGYVEGGHVGYPAPPVKKPPPIITGEGKGDPDYISPMSPVLKDQKVDDISAEQIKSPIIGPGGPFAGPHKPLPDIIIDTSHEVVTFAMSELIAIITISCLSVVFAILIIIALRIHAYRIHKKRMQEITAEDSLLEETISTDEAYDNIDENSDSHSDDFRGDILGMLGEVRSSASSYESEENSFKKRHINIYTNESIQSLSQPV